ncbi:MAG: DUF3861 domain-containing protein [Alistipes sp.]|nr:DUF3861 domain-containing protein [Alistipes sp.]
MKKLYKYHITLEMIEDRDGLQLPEPVGFDLENHDNIFGIITLLEKRDLFNDPQQVKEFTLGLKLLGGVLLKNQESPLFEDFTPAFRNLMKRLKSSN